MFEISLILTGVFIFGTVIGSFVGVIVDRLYREEQFIKGTSYCEKCKTQLKWNDMFPVLSFVLLKGKCRYCKAPLPISLPLIELSTGLLLVVLFYVSFATAGDQLLFSAVALYKFIFLLVMFILLEIIFFMDAKYMVIPMIPLYLAAGFYLLHEIFAGELLSNLEYNLYGALAMFIFFAGIHFFSKGQMMGEGDIYLAVFLGFILGLDLSILMWLLSFIFGAAYGVYLMILKGANLKQHVPFGPFIILGFLTSYSIGIVLLNFYYSLLFR